MKNTISAVVDAIESGMTDGEFARFQRLLLDQAGIRLGDAKKALLIGRLSKRVRQLGLPSFEYYYHYVTEASHREELVHMLDLVSTNETHFFREPRQFEFIEDELIPKWRAEGRTSLSIWSAGCSTGEEPYSLAMLLDAHLPDCNVEILATDLSTRVLQRAMSGVWSVDKAHEIPPAFLRRYMLRGVGAQQGTMKVHEELRSRVRFRRVNLNDAVYGVGGPFDLVLCRNVLIYFESEVRLRVIDRLTDSLVPGGHLFLGHSETLSGVSTRMASVRPTIWTKR
ncbi:MAG TPA: protein-glutamate O-methyltransferase CheR [Thermoanaerobaculia bacterium]